MNIKDIQMRALKIPFKLSFKHASAERSSTESVIVIAESFGRNSGYGEGCPRVYVTGETVKSCLDFFKKHKASLLEFHSLNDIKTWVEKNDKEIDHNPSAWCAIEIALLDLLAKEHNRSIEHLLNLDEICNKFYYSAVLGEGSYETFRSQFEQYVQMGFKDFKVKISGDLRIDKRKIDLLGTLDRKDLRVRLDANNLWKSPGEAIAFLKALDYPFYAIEEPVKTNLYNDLLNISTELNTPIVLDESFMRKVQFQHLEHPPDSWIINIRVSKMGGILRSLDIARNAKRRNIKIIIGAHVGETSILTRAAITLANSFRDTLVGQEGGFGTYLLEEDICSPPLMFGNKGILNVSKSMDPHKKGLGLNVKFNQKDFLF
ncbi:MAG: enolase C-terminal domain-like protein [Thermodesulfobacteriota bacterium]